MNVNDTWHKNIGCMGAWPLVKDLLGFLNDKKSMEPPDSLIKKVARAVWEDDLCKRAGLATEKTLHLWRDQTSNMFAQIREIDQKDMVLGAGRVDTWIATVKAVEQCNNLVGGGVEAEWTIRQAEEALKMYGNNQWNTGTCAGAAAFFTGLASWSVNQIRFDSSFVQSCVLMAFANTLAARGLKIDKIRTILTAEVKAQNLLLELLESEALQVYGRRPATEATSILNQVLRRFRRVEVEVDSWPDTNAHKKLIEAIGRYEPKDRTKVAVPIKYEQTIIPRSMEEGFLPKIAQLTDALKAANEVMNGSVKLAAYDVSNITCKNENQARRLKAYLEACKPRSQEDVEKLAADWLVDDNSKDNFN